MLTLTTQTKIKIAKLLSAVILKTRSLTGQKSRDIFRRGGLRWELDLSEGIDLSIFLFGCFERDVRKAYQRILNPGAVILDIGANIGAHTLPMALSAGSTGKVFAFEPTVFAIEKMKANLKLNPELEQRIEVLHTLLNDGIAPAPEAIPSSWNLARHSDPTTHPKHGGSYKPLGDDQTTSVDAFVERCGLSEIDLIKLDVDGNEWSALQGARTTLQAHRPVILMEFAPDYDPPAFEHILRLFVDLNYKAYSLNEKRSLPLTPIEIRRMVPKDGSINVLLRPQTTQ
jgi:FkbM family methyltransferase